MKDRTRTRRSRTTAEDVGRRVKTIWYEVLTAPNPPSDDATFFDLDGDSIAAARIVTRVEEEFGVLMDIGVLFDDPNVLTFTRSVADLWSADDQDV